MATVNKFSPYFFIGLGGSGGKVVDRIAGKLQRHPAWSRLTHTTHFVAIDTNEDDLNKKIENIPPANRFLISSFDRPQYVKRKKGELELPEDPQVTQWIHPDYNFRETKGAGAGQIRVEARLGLHFNLEDDRAGIRDRLKKMLDEATEPHNPDRNDKHRVVNIMLYGSLAGGTGSGTFLMMAYLLKDLVEEHGWANAGAKVIANLMLPSVFLGKVKEELHPTINANAYAALKELEHLTRIGYPGCLEQEQFQYDPNIKKPTYVTERPFALSYIVDKPADLSIEHYYDTLADNSYLQIFEPFLGTQEGAYDNYERHQGVLALKHFTVHYGSYGTSILHFPRQDLLHYAGLRYAARAFDKYMNFADEENSFSVPWGDPSFERLSDEEKAKKIDSLFVSWLEFKAGEEKKEDYSGSFTAICEQKKKGNEDLREVFAQRLMRVFEGVGPKIEIEVFNPASVQPQNTSLQNQLSNLRRDINSSRSKVMGEYLQTMLAEVSSGSFLEGFFKETGQTEGQGLDPLAQQLFLIRLVSENLLDNDDQECPAFGPFEDREENEVLFAGKENPADVDSRVVDQQVKDYEKKLAGAAEQGLMGSLLDRDNEKFKGAKKKVADYFNDLRSDNHRWLESQFWQRFHDALRSAIDSRLEAFRTVASIANDRAAALNKKAQMFLENPGAVEPEAQCAQYYLDLEALRDDRAGKRLWDRFFVHRLDSPNNFDDEKVFSLITTSFRPVKEDGKARAKDAREIAQSIEDGLIALGRSSFERVFADMPDLNIQGMLELEARYVLAGERVWGLKRLERDKTLGGIEEAKIREYMDEKVSRAMDHCILLANIDPGKQNPDVKVASSFMFGLHPNFCGEGALALRDCVMRIAGGEASNEDIPWDDEDRIVFYRSQLGMPLYYYSRVTGAMHDHYQAVKPKVEMLGPLHIDKRWEVELPNLDPMEIRKAQERRIEQEQASRSQSARSEQLWCFSIAAMQRMISYSPEDGYVLNRAGQTKPLAPHRWQAFDRFLELSQTLREDLESEARVALQTGETKKERQAVLDRLATWADELKSSYARAEMGDAEKDMAFLAEERELLESRTTDISKG